MVWFMAPFLVYLLHSIFNVTIIQHICMYLLWTYSLICWTNNRTDKIIQRLIPSSLQFAAASFSLYVIINPEENILDTKKAFVSLNLINILSVPMSIFQMTLSMIMQVSVSLKRLNEFLRRYFGIFQKILVQVLFKMKTWPY